MAGKRHTPKEMVQKLWQVDVRVGQEMARGDAILEVRMTEHTYDRWRKQYGGMGTDQLRERKRLQKDNERLRKAVPDLFILQGPPAFVRSDNGPGFVAKDVRAWIEAVGARTAFVEPSSPWENGCVESFTLGPETNC